MDSKNKVTDAIWNKAKSLIEKEKQVIYDSFEDGTCNPNTTPKNYYNEKINNK